MKVVQVVKRFGLCGGMEEYAFRLTEELSKMGIKVKVLCEVQVTETQDQIEVIKLGESRKKPRWLSHIQFSNKVSRWVKDHAEKNEVIHSHERISCHHVTTIHSTLFNFPKKGFPSFRKCMNEYLEKKEISCDSLKKIVPVSHLIADEVHKKYPYVQKKLSSPIPPGITKIGITKKKFVPGKPVIGFMGKEWKRKGLPKVIKIWRELRKEIPGIELCLAGFPTQDDIGLLNNESDKVQILGYLEDKNEFFGKIDILLHPAKKEAYGMVIAEASSIGIPVVFSKQCGAAEDEHINPKIVNNESIPLIKWKYSIIDILDFCAPKTEHNRFRSWKECASYYKQIYMEI